MAKKRPPYIEIIKYNLSIDPDFGPYARGETAVLHQPVDTSDVVNWFFYMGDLEKAREVSYAYSVYCEQEAAKRDEYEVLYDLFQAALYRSLAQKNSEAQKLWQDLVEKRRGLQEDRILTLKKAHYWIYEAYGLAKLERYVEVAEPAQLGFEGISKGKGIFPSPHRNTREYGLADILVALANFKLNPTSAGQQEAQKALMAYKKENITYSRLGYGVIFDLQFSYPDVFTPVLPGLDPEED